MSSLPEGSKQTDPHEDARIAIRFLALKAAVFILIPLAAAMIAVWWRLG